MGIFFHFKVPDFAKDFKSDEVPENLDKKDQTGVSFKAWLNRDPKMKLEKQKYDFELGMWWERNFYPNLQILANDLYKKGVIEADNYTINANYGAD